MTKDFSDIFEFAKNKTRVSVFSSAPKITKLFLEILAFNEKEFDYISKDQSQINHSDFVILESSNIEEIAAFQPNIVLISDEIQAEIIPPIFENIIAGGVLIFPEIHLESVRTAENYFRKLPFQPIEWKMENDDIFISTEMGEIPLKTKDLTLISNLNGLQLLAQQFGILEESFFEPVMNFE